MHEREGHYTEVLLGDKIRGNSKMTAMQNIWHPVTWIFLLLNCYMCFCEPVPDGHCNYILQWITGLRGGHLHVSSFTIYALRVRKACRKETKANVEKTLTGSILVFLWLLIALYINRKLLNCQNIFTFCVNSIDT